MEKDILLGEKKYMRLKLRCDGALQNVKKDIGRNCLVCMVVILYLHPVSEKSAESSSKKVVSE
jgi:hypothetical protein